MKKDTSIPDMVREIHDNKKPIVIQETKPIRISKNKNNDQCSFYICKELKKKLRFRAYEEDRTITETIVASIELYLKT